MTSPRKKNWVVKRDDKMRGAFGETDYEKKVIRINVKRHKSSAPKIAPKDNGHEHLGKTIFHEFLHKRHPEWTERQVRKHEKSDWPKLSTAQKKSYYDKIKKKKHGKQKK